MTQITPIEDAYIDDVIKSEGPFNPNLNKTQGIKLRELVKLLRDRMVQATETRAGIAMVATVDQALAKLSDTEMMTPAKLGALIDSEKKWFKFQVAMTGETEQAILMEYAGQIDSSMLGGCNDLKLKIGVNGDYPNDAQVFPFTFNIGDRVFFTFKYDDLMFAKCNVILKGKYN